MGCASSTEVTTDPITGEKKEKKKLGGSYPGNRRPQNAPYMPPQSDYQKVDGQMQATAHFVAYGGGNALTLMDKPNQGPQLGGGSGNAPEYVQVTLPANVKPGDKIHVAAPDGRLNEVIVPPGMGPGSTFTVDFQDAPPPSAAAVPAPTSEPYNPYAPEPTATPTPAAYSPYVPDAAGSTTPAVYTPYAAGTQQQTQPAAAPASAVPPPQNPQRDDGFASGF
mmetsp:Transcript_6300/g.7729  ORF Transcript_6300/g.7729 Transcript_6300/m.7729 type:complete len:222 (-) Transcript_6300:198-863(-)